MPRKRPSKSVRARGAKASPPPAAASARRAPKAVRRPAPAAPTRSVAAAAMPRGSSARPLGRVERYTRLLLEERKRLRQELSEMEEHQVKTEEKPVAEVSGYDDDLVDVATETFEREKGLALESSVQGLLEMVEEALGRIRSGTYGVCNGCGRPIDANRLLAIPYARLCIKCKEQEERRRSAAR